MNKLILPVIFSCISFTASTIMYLLFSSFSIFPAFTEKMALTMLFISFCISFLCYLLSFLPIYNPTTLRIIEMGIVFGLLLLANFLFDMFPFNFYYAPLVMLIGLLTYGIVMLIGFGADLFSAQEINTAIINKKMEASNEKNN